MKSLLVAQQIFLAATIFASLLPACGGHSSHGSSSVSSVTVISQTVSDNKSVSTVDANATLSQVLTGPASVPGASVTIAPGTLSISADIILEKAADITSTSAASELGLGEGLEVESAGDGLIIRPSVDVNLSLPLQIILPVPSASGLQLAEVDSQRLAVVYKYYDSTKKQLTLGMKIIDGVDVTLGVDAAARRILTMKGYFGSYWVVVLNRAVTAADVPAEKASAEPILNADRVVVMQSTGVVTESSINTQQASASTLIQSLQTASILYSSFVSPYKILLAASGGAQISDVLQSTAGQWQFADGTLTIRYDNPSIVDGTDTDAAGQEVPVKMLTYGLSIKAGSASDVLSIAELIKETYTDAPSTEPKYYVNPAYDFKIIPYSSFKGLAANVGETYALPMGYDLSGIFRLDAGSQVTDLGLNRTGVTWAQGSEGLSLKDADGVSYTYKTVASTDLAQITLVETVNAGVASVTAGLGAQVKSTLGTYTVGTASQWAGDYDSVVFSTYFMRFNTNRMASLLDLKTSVSSKDFLWSVDSGVLVGRNYWDDINKTNVNSLTDMLACEAETKASCYMSSTRSYHVLNSDPAQQKVLLYRTIDVQGTFINGMLDIMTKRASQAQ